MLNLEVDLHSQNIQHKHEELEKRLTVVIGKSDD